MRIISISAFILVGLASMLRAQYAFTTLDVPGATKTEAYGISDGNIVGYFSDAGGTHGFFYNGIGFTTIDVPGSPQTYCTGISGDTIAGYYYQNSSSAYRGFTYVAGTFTTNIFADGSAQTYIGGVNGTNIVGYTGVHGFIYNGITFSNLDFPGGTGTTPFGIAASGIVGFYRDSASKQRGFYYNGSAFTALDYPKALFTQPYGIEGANFVGCWMDTNSYLTHGFIYNGSTFTAIDVAGAHETFTYGISSGKIVGSYTTNGVTHGFVGTPISNAVQLNITRSGAGVVLHWTNSVAGYALQSSTNFSVGPWVNLVTNPPTFNGEYTFTNSAAGTNKFYRLIK